MNDDYHHINSELIYIQDNIPGSSTQGIESRQIIEYFDSQLILHCTCQDILCTANTCFCIHNSGKTNYIRSGSIIILNIEKTQEIQSYPFYECNISCKCNLDCGNRLVQNGPRRGLVIRSCKDSKGYGLFSTETIPKGSFICTYSGEVITRTEAMRRHCKNQSSNAMNYIFCLMEHSNGKITETIVDPTVFGNIGRYINHSCEPNCLVVPVRVDNPIPKLAIFACSDIEVGNEITFDYGPHGLTSTNSNRKKCLCGMKLCRQWLPFDVY